MLKLVGLLQGGRAHSPDFLSVTFGVSRRTIFRDLNTLRDSGLPLEFDEERECYRISSAFCLPPTSFTPDEALSMIVLCHEMGHRRGLPFLAPARNAAMKVESTLPPKLREHLRGIVDSVRIKPAPKNPLDGHTTIYDELVAAIGARRKVEIHYDSFAESEKIRTRLSPYRLMFSRRSWYVIGRSALHKETRTFNIGRILELLPLDDHYRVPRGFSIDRYLGNAWHLIRERGPDCEVRVRFSKMVARNVAEVGWHSTQKLKFNDDGSLDYRVTVSGLNEISWWILGYADQATVLRPAKLRRMIADRARRMVGLYGD